VDWVGNPAVGPASPVLRITPSSSVGDDPAGLERLQECPKQTETCLGSRWHRWGWVVPILEGVECRSGREWAALESGGP
jgi:hypothetical protein